MSTIKTGSVIDRDDDDNLWLCESFQDSDTGEVWTTRTLFQMRGIEENIQQIESDF